MFLSIKACKPKPKEPRIYAGHNSDFGRHLENFLEKIPPKQHIPIIHALVFLSEQNLDPDYYPDQTIEEAKLLSFTDDILFKLNTSTVTEILDLTHKQFNYVQQDQMMALEVMRERLANFEEELKTQREEEAMLYRIRVQDLQFEYKKESTKVSVSISFTLANGTKKEVEGIQFSVLFQEKATGRMFDKYQRPDTWAPPLPPGGTKQIALTVSNCPTLPNVPVERYSQYIKPIFSIENAYMPDGAFRKIVNTALPEKVKELRTKVDELNTVLEKSKDRRKFTFWSILARQTSKE